METDELYCVVVDEKQKVPKDVVRIKIESSVKIIRKSMFYYHIKLKHVEFSEGLEQIDDKAFFGCSSLTNFCLPSTTRIIGQRAFQNCKNLHLVTLNEGLEDIQGHAFFRSGIESLFVPSTVLRIGACFVEECKQLKDVTLNEGLIEIPGYAFSKTGIESFTLPSTIRSVGSRSFAACKQLKNVSLNEGLEEIGDNAFKACTELKEVAVPSTVGLLSPSAFNKTDVRITRAEKRGNTPRNDSGIVQLLRSNKRKSQSSEAEEDSARSSIKTQSTTAASGHASVAPTIPVGPTIPRIVKTHSATEDSGHNGATVPAPATITNHSTTAVSGHSVASGFPAPGIAAAHSTAAAPGHSAATGFPVSRLATPHTTAAAPGHNVAAGFQVPGTHGTTVASTHVGGAGYPVLAMATPHSTTTASSLSVADHIPAQRIVEAYNRAIPAPKVAEAQDANAGRFDDANSDGATTDDEMSEIDFTQSLRGDLKKTSDQIWMVKATVSDHDEEIKSLQDAVKILEDTVASRDEEIKELRKALTDSTANLAAIQARWMKDALAKRDKDIKKLRETVTNRDGKIGQLQNAVKSLQDTVISRDGNIRQLQKNVTDTVANFAVLQKNLQTLKQQMDAKSMPIAAVNPISEVRATKRPRVEPQCDASNDGVPLVTKGEMKRLKDKMCDLIDSVIEEREGSAEGAEI